MYNHNKAQQSKNRVHISWDILYVVILLCPSMVSLQGKIYEVLTQFSSGFTVDNDHRHA